MGGLRLCVEIALVCQSEDGLERPMDDHPWGSALEKKKSYQLVRGLSGCFL
jgi:hypothetical protein